ncbi:hypothetical protein [Gordonia terrae]
MTRTPERACPGVQRSQAFANAATSRDGKVSVRALIVAMVSGALALALVTVAAPAGAAPQNNGDAKIAGTQCERAFKRIVASGAMQPAGNREAFFSCSSGEIVIDVKSADKKRSEQLILGNPQTFQTRSIKGLGPAQRDRVATELGVGDSGAQARSGLPANNCFPSTETGTFVDDSTHAHGNVSICYGRFITRGGVPVEIVWSDTLTYVMRQSLDGRTIQHFTVGSISTNQAYQIGIDFQWNQRKTELGSDPFISGPETIEMLPFNVPHIQQEEYFPSQSEGTYHLTNDYTTIHILEGPSIGAVLPTHPNLRMPDFECPSIGNGQCHF